MRALPNQCWACAGPIRRASATCEATPWPCRFAGTPSPASRARSAASKPTAVLACAATVAALISSNSRTRSIASAASKAITVDREPVPQAAQFLGGENSSRRHDLTLVHTFDLSSIFCVSLRT